MEAVTGVARCGEGKYAQAQPAQAQAQAPSQAQPAQAARAARAAQPTQPATVGSRPAHTHRCGGDVLPKSFECSEQLEQRRRQAVPHRGGEQVEGRAVARSLVHMLRRPYPCRQWDPTSLSHVASGIQPHRQSGIRTGAAWQRQPRDDFPHTRYLSRPRWPGGAPRPSPGLPGRPARRSNCARPPCFLRSFLASLPTGARHSSLRAATCRC